MIHDNSSRVNPGYTIISIDSRNSVIYVRSDQCNGKASGTSTVTAPCPSCQDIGCIVDIVRQRANREPQHLNTDTLSHNQMRKHLKALEDRMKRDRLEACINFCLDRFTWLIYSNLAALEHSNFTLTTLCTSRDMECDSRPCGHL